MQELNQAAARGESPDPTENLEEFVLKPAPQRVNMKCRITRDKRGVDRGMYPTYFVHLEREDGKKVRHGRKLDCCLGRNLGRDLMGAITWDCQFV